MANHPDTHGERSAQQMAEINTAWAVLRDPIRRQAYDLTLAPPTSPLHTDARRTGEAAGFARFEDRSGRDAPDRTPFESPGPARFPWRLMAFMASVGIGVVLLGVIIYHPTKLPPPDNLLDTGSCVVIQGNGDAAEVNCVDTHDAVVEVLVPFGAPCPAGSEPHRDHQGMGTACVTRA